MRKVVRSKRFKVSDEDFIKSTYTNSKDYRWCVEVARKRRGVAVRDSGNRSDEGILFFTNNEWQAFIKGVKKGEFEPIGPIAKRLRR